MALTRLGNIANTLPDNSIFNSKLSNIVNFKNIIINGDMSIAQRGTSATGLGNGDNGYYTCDRWTFLESGTTTYEFTMSQDTDVPSGQGFATSLKLDCTTADASLDADNLIRIAQIIEGQNLQYLKYGTANATSLTASFWVKSTVTGDYNVNLYNYGSGGGARIISSIYTINSADTWEKKTITFDGDTVEAIINNNTAGLNLAFSLGSGTDYTTTDATSWGSYSNGKLAYGQVANIASSTANNFYITGVQLEAASAPSDFEFLPVDMNLNRCQRYYYNVGTGGNNTTIFRAYVDGGGSDIWQPHPYLMRAAPTITTEGTWETEASTSQPIGRFQTTQGFSFRFTRSGGFGDAYVYANSTDDRLTIDAEL